MHGRQEFEPNLTGTTPEPLDGSRLQQAISALVIMCSALGMTVEALLSKPGPELIACAHQPGFAIEELRDICTLLLRRLDRLDLEFASVGKLIAH